MRARFFLWCAALVATATAAQADIVFLKNGSSLVGKVRQQDAEVVRLELVAGGEIMLPAAWITRIEISRTDASLPAEVAPAVPADEPATDPVPAGGETDAVVRPTEAATTPGTEASAGQADAEVAKADPDPERSPEAEAPADGDAAAEADPLEARFTSLVEAFGTDPTALAEAAMTEDPRLGLRVVERVAASAGESRLRALTLLLQHPDSAACMRAAQALGSEPDEVVLPIFARHLESAPGELQAVLLKRLKRSSDPELPHRLVAMAGRLDPRAYAEAAALLRVVSARAAKVPGTDPSRLDPVTMLTAALDAQPAPGSAQSLLELLIRLRQPGLLPVFESWASAPAAECRRVAARGLGVLSEPQATAVLVERARAEVEPLVLAEVVDALAERRSMDCLGVFVELLRHPARSVQSAAREALRAQLGVDHGDDAEAWRAEAEEVVRRVHRND